MVKYLLVEAYTSYNIIIGRPTLNQLGAVVSTSHLTMKFSRHNGDIISIKANQKIARQCYVESLKVSTPYVCQPPQAIVAHITNPTLSNLDPQSDCTNQRPSPVDELMEFQIDQNPDQCTKVSQNISPELRQQIITEIGGERRDIVAKETQKLLTPGFIREIIYNTWLANVVLVKKNTSKWRMCVNYTDLNKACPKDAYPLPSIDRLVDGVFDHALLNFLDAYSGYNQISMYPLDQDKIAFIIVHANFCYRVMPFGLKNAGATYQRLMDKVFHQQIGKKHGGLC
ncbi:uncharacterized protein LOC109801949 [Cajanus cajan]|uniref:uncharacterized protein LOC109801949 n=1 Tax=Cajanus cajan TaxID=3821 RepID=UPI00098DCE4A|nr:uncharacterized protein LOC109801949 [Cajanus cajan]